MNQLLKLVKLTFKLKLSIWQCYYLFDKNTDEHQMAKEYQHILNNMKNNTEEIESMILKTEGLKEKFKGKKAIMNLLQNITLFLRHLDQFKS